jgi:hypothetical protein
MAADKSASDLGRLGQTTAQNRGNRFRPDEIGRKTDNIEGSKWPPAHRKDVGKRIGRCDLPVGKWVVHNRCEKIYGLHKSAMSIQAINAGVIESVRAHEHVPA